MNDEAHLYDQLDIKHRVKALEEKVAKMQETQDEMLQTIRRMERLTSRLEKCR